VSGVWCLVSGVRYNLDVFKVRKSTSIVRFSLIFIVMA